MDCFNVFIMVLVTVMF